MFDFLNLFSKPVSQLNFQFNDGGRAAAGFLGSAGDCVVRAIAIATQLPYIQVYEELNQANAVYADHKNDKLARHINKRGSSPRNGNHRKVFHDYILARGFIWVATMKVGGGCQVHLRANELPKGTLIVKVSKHLTTVIDGVIQDTHNPAREGQRCVYGYYQKTTSGK